MKDKKEKTTTAEVKVTAEVKTSVVLKDKPSLSIDIPGATKTTVRMPTSNPGGIRRKVERRKGRFVMVADEEDATFEVSVAGELKRRRRMSDVEYELMIREEEEEAAYYAEEMANVLPKQVFGAGGNQVGVNHDLRAGGC